jgi:deoxyribose-phosphate aldolase
MMDKKTIAAMIDHTLLKPEATPAQIEKLCAEAAEYHFASVCVNPVYIPLAARLLKGTGVKVCCVVGFPLGAIAPEQKAAEAASCAAMGAEELDMVIHVGAAKAGDWALVQRDIEGVVKAAAGHTVKVIIETCLLTDEEKVKACEAAKAAGAHFVKTSTGFSTGGATTHDIALMRKTVGPEMGVKASGGIRDYATAMAMIEAGANRIGASAGIAIVAAAE